MKILISANNYPTPRYPLQAFIGVFCQELTRQGHEVTVIAPQPLLSALRHRMGIVPQIYEEYVDTNIGKKPIKIFRPLVIAPGSGGKLGGLTRWIIRRKIFNVAESLKEKYDIVYAHFWLSATNISKYADDKKLPLIVASGEDVIMTSTLGGHEDIEKLKNQTRGVICVSSKNRDESINSGLTTEDKCIVLPNSVDCKVFYKMNKTIERKKLGINENDIVVAFCGRFIDRKGVFRVAEAIDRINKDDLKVMFIGRPIEGQKALPSCKGIIHCGALPHNDVAKYLNAADIFVLPSLAEGCSNSIVEAMACGLPIISSDLPFNYDILDDKNSILIDPLNVEQIVDAILQLYENKEKRDSMSLASADYAQKLTIEKRVQRIINFILTRI